MPLQQQAYLNNITLTCEGLNELVQPLGLPPVSYKRFDQLKGYLTDTNLRMLVFMGFCLESLQLDKSTFARIKANIGTPSAWPRPFNNGAYIHLAVPEPLADNEGVLTTPKGGISQEPKTQRERPTPAALAEGKPTGASSLWAPGLSLKELYSPSAAFCFSSLRVRKLSEAMKPLFTGAYATLGVSSLYTRRSLSFGTVWTDIPLALIEELISKYTPYMRRDVPFLALESCLKSRLALMPHRIWNTWD